MRVVVIGAGGVGLALAATLASAGARVRLVTRSEAAAVALSAHGVSRTGLFGDLHLPPGEIAAVSDIDALRGEAPDFILVCTKTPSSVDVAESLGEIWEDLGSEPAVVLFQNGWGNSEAFARHLPKERIFCTSNLIGFRRSSAHSATVTVHAKAIQVGSLFGVPVDGVATLALRIQQGGIPCQACSEIARELWAKMLYNCALNPLGALLRVPYGALADSPHARSVMDEVVHEVFTVMRAAGYETFWRSPTAYLAAFYQEILPPTREHESSMLQDLRAGRATEIDALSGAIDALGKHYGIATPTNSALATLIRAQGN